MANLTIIGKSFSVPATVQGLILAGGTLSANVATKVIQLVGTSPVGFSITVRGRITGTTNAFVAIPYRKRYLNGAVADDTFVSTAITSDSLIEVNADGIDVLLDVTAATSGSFAATQVDLKG